MAFIAGMLQVVFTVIVFTASILSVMLMQWSVHPFPQLPKLFQHPKEKFCTHEAINPPSPLP